MLTINEIAPVLHVKDVGASIAWYKKFLHFQGDGFPPVPPHGFGILSHGKQEIMLQQDDAVLPRSPRPYQWDVYLRLEGIDIRALYAELNALRIVTRRLERMPYGQAEFELADPDGHVIVLGQPLTDDMGDLPQPRG